jgi:hypothetical protein
VKNVRVFCGDPSGRFMYWGHCQKHKIFCSPNGHFLHWGHCRGQESRNKGRTACYKGHRFVHFRPCTAREKRPACYAWPHRFKHWGPCQRSLGDAVPPGQ